jgi:Na+/proline symporter
MKQPKEQRTNEGIEQLATVIAGNIVKSQRRMATVLNKRANQMSSSRQLWMLAICCILVAGALISNVLWPQKMVVAGSAKNYIPTHIGMPSEMPRNTKPTDSLTIKK